MEDRLNTKYNGLVESIREIELIVQNKIGSKMMAEMAVKVKDDFEQRKIHLSKPEFKYAETRQNIEQLKGQRIGMPTVVELEDFFKLKEKVDPSQIAKIHRELNEIEGKFNKNHGERLSTDQLDMLETKGRLLSNFLKFLKQTISENKVFLKLLAQEFSHLYEKEMGSAHKREVSSWSKCDGCIKKISCSNLLCFFKIFWCYVFS
jgi:tetrahydromethanopterin S-methyltransferase subunit G